LRFERIVKTIEGTTKVDWKSSNLTFPNFKDESLQTRLTEIELKKQALSKELDYIESEIQHRKQHLRKLHDNSKFN
jgi:hypothetical protein